MRARTVVVAASLVLAACGASSSSKSPSTTAGASTTASPNGSLAGLGTMSADKVSSVLASEPANALTPDLAALVADIQKQVGDKLTLPTTFPSFGGVGNAVPRPRDLSLGTMLEIADLLITGIVTPSKASSEALTGIASTVASEGGRDGPDGPESGQTEQSAPFDSSGTGTSTVGTLTVAVTGSHDHSLTKIDMTRSLSMHVTTANSSTTITAFIHNVESVDFCPDASGTVPIEIMSDYSASSGGTTVHYNITGSFKGTVDDNANLASVTGDAKTSGAQITGTSTSNEYGIDFTGVGFGVQDGTVGPANSGHYQDTVNNVSDIQTKMDAALTDMKGAVSTIMSKSAALWQNNKCVLVEIPDFQAVASPHGPPGEVDFVKKLAPKAKLDFTTQVHHRFDHTTLNVKVKQTLASEVKLDPPLLASTPGHSTYEAPDKIGAGNDGTFESTSRRGKSVLKGRFFTEESPPTIAIAGTLVADYGFIKLTGTVTVPATLLSAVGGSTDAPQMYEGDAPITTEITLDSIAGGASPCKAFGTEEGTIHLIAHSEARGEDTRVWVIQSDPGNSHVQLTITCQITVGNALDSGGGYGPKFFAALGKFEIPTVPGTTTVSGTHPLPIGSDSSTATVTLIAPPTGG